MTHIYANRSSITTTDAGEVFISFSMHVPEYNDKGEKIGTQEQASQMIVMSSDAYNSFKEMLDSLKKKEEEEK